MLMPGVLNKHTGCNVVHPGRAMWPCLGFTTHEKKCRCLWLKRLKLTAVISITCHFAGNQQLAPLLANLWEIVNAFPLVANFARTLTSRPGQEGANRRPKESSRLWCDIAGHSADRHTGLPSPAGSNGYANSGIRPSGAPKNSQASITVLFSVCTSQVAAIAAATLPCERSMKSGQFLANLFVFHALLEWRWKAWTGAENTAQR